MFRTEIHPRPSDQKITYNNRIMTIGSCFAETIGARLENRKFDILANPFGVIFNPISQFKLLSYAINREFPEDPSYLQNQSVFYNYDLHSDFSALSLEELKLKVEGSINQTHEFLKTTDWLFFTFGTAIGYYLKTSNNLVANCHKVPSREFEKKLISKREISDNFKALLKELQDLNPDIKIIVTVSPVRHLKETLELNSVSKSILRLATYFLENDFEEVTYFPAYELLLDDLRDYRFYADDLLHPNKMGEKYIWEKFYTAFLDEKSISTMTEWEKVRKSLKHKPFHSESEAHKKFLADTFEKLQALSNELNVSRELEALKKQLGEEPVN